MKRRNAECGKLRRPIKRNKITEGMYGSTTVLYMKFLILWAIVITADFMFMFRFEFLWPFWLLLRSVHDSFKYKGLAFSVLFVCIAITSDLVCLFFIPVHWLLFAASTYVWVQYVWHTDKGICLPTIILWMLFVYLEAGIRWKDSRHMPHLDLCRPFAAHCIGYPVVTLGFGFKSYVGYRMRQRKQREVSKENEFYMQLLQQALPPEESPEDAQATATAATTSSTAAIGSGSVNSSMTAISSAQNAQSSVHANHSNAITTTSPTAMPNAPITANGILTTQAQNHQHHHHNDHHTHHNNTSSSSNNTNSSSNNNSITAALSATLSASGGSNNTTAGATSTITSSLSNVIDDKSCVQIGGNGGGGGATTNGHIGGNTKSHRRSMDKENKNKGANNSNIGDNETTTKHNNKSNNYQQLHVDSGNSPNNGKDRSDYENSNYQVHQMQSQSAKDKHDDSRASKKSNNTHNSSGSTTSPANGNVLQYDADDAVVVEPVEKTKGRRNRSKKDNSSKDNHHQQQHHHNNSHSNNNNSNNSSNHLHNNQQQQQNSKDTTTTHNHHNNNSDASSVSSSASTSSTHSSSSSSLTAPTFATSAISNLASKVVSKICESCLKLEADIKKCRSEISHMKQIENELRQKLESNLTTKSCLQAKQKECDEMEKRIQELSNARHADLLSMQNFERRLTEERRQKQSLDAQLGNEKKARKLAEEKAARPECSAQCKQRKHQMDEDIKQLRRDLKVSEEAKQMAEQHGRKWEQELRMFEAEIRNRDSNQPGTEMLMNALAAMQDKNCTLEKNLSAETRVKLDLFSALGDAKRQLEIAESRRRAKEDEVHDLKAKIAQLLAVMPTDSLCLPACSSTGASSMLRMNDTPPLQTCPGPASPMLSSLSAQQTAAANAHQMNARVGPPNSPDYVQQVPPEYVSNQQQQQQCVVPVSLATSVLGSGPSGVVVGTTGVANNSGVVNAVGSNHPLDPNATIYTPKGGPNMGGAPGSGVVVVGSSGDA